MFHKFIQLVTCLDIDVNEEHDNDHYPTFGYRTAESLSDEVVAIHVAIFDAERVKAYLILRHGDKGRRNQEVKLPIDRVDRKGDQIDENYQILQLLYII